MLKNIFIIISVALVLVAGTALAIMPQTISYQGYLTDNNGVPEVNTVSVTFAIYDVASGGTVLWSDTQSVTPTSGVFEVILSPTLPFDHPYWLGITVESDAEMSERMPLAAVGNTFRAVNADDVADGSIGGDMISDGAISLQKLADTCVPGEVLRQTVSGWACGPSPH